MGWYVFLFTLQASNLLALLFLGKNSWSFWLSLISRTSRAPCLGFECLWLLAKCAHQRLTSRMVSADSSHLLTLPSWNRKPCWTRSSRLRSCWGKAMSFCKHLHWHWTSRHIPWPATSPDLACFSWTKKAKGRKGKNIQAWPTSLMLSLLNALKWSNMDIWMQGKQSLQRKVMTRKCQNPWKVAKILSKLLARCSNWRWGAITPTMAKSWSSPRLKRIQPPWSTPPSLALQWTTPWPMMIWKASSLSQGQYLICTLLQILLLSTPVMQWSRRLPGPRPSIFSMKNTCSALAAIQCLVAQPFFWVVHWLHTASTLLQDWRIWCGCVQHGAFVCQCRFQEGWADFAALWECGCGGQGESGQDFSGPVFGWVVTRRSACGEPYQVQFWEGHWLLVTFLLVQGEQGWQRGKAQHDKGNCEVWWADHALHQEQRKADQRDSFVFGAHRGIQESKEEMTLQHEAVGKKIKPSQAFHFGLNKPLESWSCRVSYWIQKTCTHALLPFEL